MLVEIDCPLNYKSLSFSDSTHKEHRVQGTLLNGCFQNRKVILYLSWHLPVQSEQWVLHEKKNFRLTKICEKDKKDHIFASFRMFLFH